jgi:hypothetical protein
LKNFFEKSRIIDKSKVQAEKGRVPDGEEEH